MLWGGLDLKSKGGTHPLDLFSGNLHLHASQTPLSPSATSFGYCPESALPHCWSFATFPEMNQQRSGCLALALIACILLLAISVAMNLVFAAGRGSMVGQAAERPKMEKMLMVPSKQKSEAEILVVHLRGLISGMEPGSYGETAVDDIKLQFEQAAEDERVKAVVLHVDSPGGEVTASDIIYNSVRKFRDEKKKPVVVYMGSLAASGGYYVSCGANHVVANDTTLTGSIGVIMSSLKYKQLLDKVGVEQVVFKSGKFKDMLSGSRDLTDEEREYIQKMVMQTYDKFVGIVARERKLPEDELRNGIADGRVLSGKDAFEAKLVDQLGSIEDAYAKAGELGAAPNAAVVRYESPFRLGKLLNLLGKADAPRKVEVDLSAGMLPRLEPGKVYLLPSYLVQ
jgi:protease-4